jgi:hypothetical protein
MQQAVWCGRIGLEKSMIRSPCENQATGTSAAQ